MEDEKWQDNQMSEGTEGDREGYKPFNSENNNSGENAGRPRIPRPPSVFVGACSLIGYFQKRPFFHFSMITVLSWPWLSGLTDDQSHNFLSIFAINFR